MKYLIYNSRSKTWRPLRATESPPDDATILVLDHELNPPRDLADTQDLTTTSGIAKTKATIQEQHVGKERKYSQIKGELNGWFGWLYKPVKIYYKLVAGSWSPLSPSETLDDDDDVLELQLPVRHQGEWTKSVREPSAILETTDKSISGQLKKYEEIADEYISYLGETKYLVHDEATNSWRPITQGEILGKNATVFRMDTPDPEVGILTAEEHTLVRNIRVIRETEIVGTKKHYADIKGEIATYHATQGAPTQAVAHRGPPTEDADGITGRARSVFGVENRAEALLYMAALVNGDSTYNTEVDVAGTQSRPIIEIYDMIQALPDCESKQKLLRYLIQFMEVEEDVNKYVSAQEEIENQNLDKLTRALAAGTNLSISYQLDNGMPTIDNIFQANGRLVDPDKKCYLGGGWKGHFILYEIVEEANGQQFLYIHNTGDGYQRHDYEISDDGQKEYFAKKYKLPDNVDNKRKLLKNLLCTRYHDLENELILRVVHNSTVLFQLLEQYLGGDHSVEAQIGMTYNQLVSEPYNRILSILIETHGLRRPPTINIPLTVPNARALKSFIMDNVGSADTMQGALDRFLDSHGKRDRKTKKGEEFIYEHLEDVCGAPIIDHDPARKYPLQKAGVCAIESVNQMLKQELSAKEQFLLKYERFRQSIELLRIKIENDPTQAGHIVLSWTEKRNLLQATENLSKLLDDAATSGVDKSKITEGIRFIETTVQWINRCSVGKIQTSKPEESTVEAVILDRPTGIEAYQTNPAVNLNLDHWPVSILVNIAAYQAQLSTIVVGHNYSDMDKIRLFNQVSKDLIAFDFARMGNAPENVEYIHQILLRYREISEMAFPSRGNKVDAFRLTMAKVYRNLTINNFPGTNKRTYQALTERYAQDPKMARTEIGENFLEPLEPGDIPVAGAPGNNKPVPLLLHESFLDIQHDGVGTKALFAFLTNSLLFNQLKAPAAGGPTIPTAVEVYLQAQEMSNAVTQIARDIQFPEQSLAIETEKLIYGVNAFDVRPTVTPRQDIKNSAQTIFNLLMLMTLVERNLGYDRDEITAQQYLDTIRTYFDSRWNAAYDNDFIKMINAIKLKELQCHLQNSVFECAIGDDRSAYDSKDPKVHFMILQKEAKLRVQPGPTGLKTIDHGCIVGPALVERSGIAARVHIEHKKIMGGVNFAGIGDPHPDIAKVLAIALTLDRKSSTFENTLATEIAHYEKQVFDVYMREMKEYIAANDPHKSVPREPLTTIPLFRLALPHSDPQHAVRNVLNIFIGEYKELLNEEDYQIYFERMIFTPEYIKNFLSLPNGPDNTQSAIRFFAMNMAYFKEKHGLDSPGYLFNQRMLHSLSNIISHELPDALNKSILLESINAAIFHDEAEINTIMADNPIIQEKMLSHTIMIFLQLDNKRKSMPPGLSVDEQATYRALFNNINQHWSFISKNFPISMIADLKVCMVNAENDPAFAHPRLLAGNEAEDGWRMLTDSRDFKELFLSHGQIVRQPSDQDQIAFNHEGVAYQAFYSTTVRKCIIHRNINGQNYQYVSSEHAAITNRLPSYVQYGLYKMWYAVDAAQDPSVYLTDNNGEIVYRYHQGILRKGIEATSPAILNITGLIPDGSALQLSGMPINPHQRGQLNQIITALGRFEDISLIEFIDAGGGKLKINLPRYKGLVFDVEHLGDANLVIKITLDREEFTLDLSENIDSGVGNFDNCLRLIQEIEKKEQILIPQQRFAPGYPLSLDTKRQYQLAKREEAIEDAIKDAAGSLRADQIHQTEQYLVFDRALDSSETLEAKNVEQCLYLAYIHLARGQVDEAHRYLNQIQSLGGLAGSVNELELLYAILRDLPGTENTKIRESMPQLGGFQTNAARMKVYALICDFQKSGQLWKDANGKPWKETFETYYSNEVVDQIKRLRTKQIINFIIGNENEIPGFIRHMESEYSIYADNINGLNRSMIYQNTLGLVEEQQIIEFLNTNMTVPTSVYSEQRQKKLDHIAVLLATPRTLLPATARTRLTIPDIAMPPEVDEIKKTGRYQLLFSSNPIATTTEPIDLTRYGEYINDLEKHLLDTINAIYIEQVKLEIFARRNQPYNLAILVNHYLNDDKRISGFSEQDTKVIYRKIEELLKHKVRQRAVELINKIPDEEFSDHEKRREHQVNFEEAITEPSLTVCIEDSPSSVTVAERANKKLQLVFEYAENICLRQKQKALLAKIGTDDSITIEMIMGGGKSKVLLPMLAQRTAHESDLVHKKLAMIIVPDAMFQSNLKDMNSTTMKVFGQEGKPFIFTRDTVNTAKNAKLVYEYLKGIIDNKQYLITTSTSIQSIKLKYYELIVTFNDLEPGDKKEDVRKQIGILKDTIDLVRSSGYAYIDESDTVLDIRQEYRYAIGTKETIDYELVELNVELFDYLLDVRMATDDKSWLIDILNEDKRTADTTKKVILELMLDEKSPLWKRISVIDETCKIKIRHYLEGKITFSSLEEVGLTRSAEKALRLYKAQLGLLPYTLEKIYDKDYAYSATRSSLLAIPCKTGIKREGSRFANLLEEMNFSIQAALLKPLPAEHVKTFIEELHALANKTTDTTEAEYAAFLAKFSLLEAADFHFQTLRGHLLTAGEIHQLIEVINKSPKTKLKIVQHLELNKMMREPSSLASSPLDHVSLYQAAKGLTGTPWNTLSLHRKIQKIVRAQRGGVGERSEDDQHLIENIQNKSKTGVYSIDAQNMDNVASLLMTIAGDAGKKNNTRAIIDVAGTLLGKPREQVARDIRTVLNDHDYPEEIQYILFYNDANELCAIKRIPGGSSDNPILLKTTDKDEMAKLLGFATADACVKACFTYYDQSHTTGSDIKQIPTANAVVTLGEQVMERDLLQGVMRLRQFNEGQSVTMVIRSDAKLLDRAETSASDITAADIVKHCASYQQKIADLDVSKFRNALAFHSLKELFDEVIAACGSDVDMKAAYLKILQEAVPIYSKKADDGLPQESDDLTVSDVINLWKITVNAQPVAPQKQQILDIIDASQRKLQEEYDPHLDILIDKISSYWSEYERNSLVVALKNIILLRNADGSPMQRPTRTYTIEQVLTNWESYINLLQDKLLTSRVMNAIYRIRMDLAKNYLLDLPAHHLDFKLTSKDNPGATVTTQQQQQQQLQQLLHTERPVDRTPEPRDYIQLPSSMADWQALSTFGLHTSYQPIFSEFTINGLSGVLQLSGQFEQTITDATQHFPYKPATSIAFFLSQGVYRCVLLSPHDRAKLKDMRPKPAGIRAIIDLSDAETTNFVLPTAITAAGGPALTEGVYKRILAQAYFINGNFNLAERCDFDWVNTHRKTLISIAKNDLKNISDCNREQFHLWHQAGKVFDIEFSDPLKFIGGELSDRSQRIVTEMLNMINPPVAGETQPSRVQRLSQAWDLLKPHHFDECNVINAFRSIDAFYGQYLLKIKNAQITTAPGTTLAAVFQHPLPIAEVDRKALLTDSHRFRGFLAELQEDLRMLYGTNVGLSFTERRKVNTLLKSINDGLNLLENYDETKILDLIGKMFVDSSITFMDTVEGQRLVHPRTSQEQIKNLLQQNILEKMQLMQQTYIAKRMTAVPPHAPSAPPKASRPEISLVDPGDQRALVESCIKSFTGDAVIIQDKSTYSSQFDDFTTDIVAFSTIAPPTSGFTDEQFSKFFELCQRKEVILHSGNDGVFLDEENHSTPEARGNAEFILKFTRWLQEQHKTAAEITGMKLTLVVAYKMTKDEPIETATTIDENHLLAKKVVGVRAETLVDKSTNTAKSGSHFGLGLVAGALFKAKDREAYRAWLHTRSDLGSEHPRIVDASSLVSHVFRIKTPVVKVAAESHAAALPHAHRRAGAAAILAAARNPDEVSVQPLAQHPGGYAAHQLSAADEANLRSIMDQMHSLIPIGVVS